MVHSRKSNQKFHKNAFNFSRIFLSFNNEYRVSLRIDFTCKSLNNNEWQISTVVKNALILLGFLPIKKRNCLIHRLI